jgi:hypothetical protein
MLELFIALAIIAACLGSWRLPLLVWTLAAFAVFRHYMLG